MSDGQTALDQLIARVPPPAGLSPVTLDWGQVFAAFETELPWDFVEFAERYGACEFNQWLGVNDFRHSHDGDPRRGPQSAGDVYRVLRSAHPASYPFAARPEPEGFLAWGAIIDGDHFGWLTVGDPDDWPVVVWPRHREQGPAVHVPMTEFLLHWVSGSALRLPELPVFDEITCGVWACRECAGPVDR
ncbi:hypothetical protein GCM10010517_25120 [Streptosporangium fragile]|uniref:SMI1/KNR4 family protein n=1 Tax=Streptosporangium fragile TaxID=46186 RepID=A0ABN3VVU5_9ACTN